MRARSTWNSCFISFQSLYLIFSFWCFFEQLRKRRLSTFHATANPRPSPVSLNFLRCTPSHQKTMKKVEFLQISWTLTWIYNMRFTFPWVFVENTPHLIWIKPEPHTHSLPPWPCNGWANVFSRHQKCISRRKKCICFLIFPTLFSSFTVVVVGKSETCRLSASISWDAFRKGRSLARNHISIFLTFQLTKAEELPTLCIEKPELTKTEFLKLLQCWVAEVGGTWDQRSPKAYGICERKEILWFVAILIRTFATGTW